MQMKKIFVLLVLISSYYNAQIVQSLCTSTDSITQLWKKEATRLTLRRTYKIASNYKDSVKPDPALQQRYLKALLAVYNATSIAETDTLFKQLFVRTRPDPEMHRLRVNASPNLSWMIELFNNQAPTTNAVISNLMLKYNMSYLYLQSVSNDVVVFMPDSALNLPVLIPKYLSQGATSATNEASFDDTRDITDSLNTNFVQLSYAFGWTNCNDGCDYRRISTFKVYNDCSVEFLGTTGVSLYVGIADFKKENLQFNFINPSTNHFTLVGTVPNAKARVYSSDGRLLQHFECQAGQSTYQLNQLANGIYFIELQSALGKSTKRFIIAD